MIRHRVGSQRDGEAGRRTRNAEPETGERGAETRSRRVVFHAVREGLWYFMVI